MIEKKYVCNICGEKHSETLYRGQLTDIIRQQIVVLEKRKSTTIPRNEIHLCEECKTHIETKIRDEITKIARRNGQLQTTKNSPRCLNQIDGLELHEQKEEASE